MKRELFGIRKMEMNIVIIAKIANVDVGLPNQAIGITIAYQSRP